MSYCAQFSAPVWQSWQSLKPDPQPFSLADPSVRCPGKNVMPFQTSLSSAKKTLFVGLYNAFHNSPPFLLCHSCLTPPDPTETWLSNTIQVRAITAIANRCKPVLTEPIPYCLSCPMQSTTRLATPLHSCRGLPLPTYPQLSTTAPPKLSMTILYEP